MRADFDEHAAVVLHQAFDDLAEAHHGAQVVVPVRGVEHAGVEQSAGDRGVELHRRLPRRKTRGVLEQTVADGFDVVGVRGVVHLDPAHPDVLAGRHRGELVQCRAVSGDHHRGRPVDGGHRQPPRPLLQPVVDPCGGRGHRAHPAAQAGQFDQRPAAQGDDPGRVLERQGARCARRGDLALRVAHDGVGHHAQRAPHLRQRHHHREQRGLDHVHPLQRGGRLRSGQHVHQGPVHVRGQGLRARVDRAREHLRLRVQLPAHAQPLRPLAGEHEDDRARRPRGHCANRPRRALARRDQIEAGQRLLAVTAQHHCTVVEQLSRGHQRVADVCRRQRVVRGDEVAQAGSLRAQGRLRAGREHPRLHAGGVRPARLSGCGAGFRLRLGGLFQDHVSGGAAQPERGHAGAARPPVRSRPGPRGPDDLEVLVEVLDVGVRGAEVHARDEVAAVHAERRLHEADESGGRLQVPDVRLHRSDRQGTAAAALPEHLAQTGDFGGIAHPCAGAVGLDVVDVVERNTRAGEGGQHGRGLPGGAGVRHPAGRATAGDAPAAHHRVDVVAVGHGEVEPLQQDERPALSPDEAVGPFVEGEAGAVGRQGAQVRQAESRFRIDDQLHAAGEGHVDRAAADPVAGQRQRHERGGLARVRAEAHAPDVEEARNPVRDQRAARAQGGVVVVLVAAGQLAQQLVPGGPAADHDVDLAARERGRRDPGVFDRFPSELQAQPLHGVHGGRLRSARPEELRVETVDGVEERTRFQGGGVRVGLVLRIGRPLLGELSDGRLPVEQQAPELTQAVHTGEAARHPDDGNIGGCATHTNSFRFPRNALAGCTAFIAGWSEFSAALPARP